MEIRIESGILYREIDDYLATISQYKSGDRYHGDGWVVTILHRRMVSMGAIQLPRTLLLFQGKEQSVTKQVAAFRLRFLSAGG